MALDREFPGVAASLSEIRQAMRDCASGAGASPALTLAVAQAVDEAATNAIVHGYGGGDATRSIAISSSDGDGWLRVLVTDRGAGFRPRRTTPGYGLGLAIIAQLADELELRDAVGGGLVVAMGFRLA